VEPGFGSQKRDNAKMPVIAGHGRKIVMLCLIWIVAPQQARAQAAPPSFARKRCSLQRR
jgi:hypothetical protein